IRCDTITASRRFPYRPGEASASERPSAHAKLTHAQPGALAMRFPTRISPCVLDRAAGWRRVLGRFLATLMLVAWAIPVTGDEKNPAKTSLRTLQGDDAKQVERLTKSIAQLRSAGQFAEAVDPAQKILTICDKALGRDHWRTADARRTVTDF